MQKQNLALPLVVQHGEEDPGVAQPNAVLSDFRRDIQPSVSTYGQGAVAPRRPHDKLAYEASHPRSSTSISPVLLLRGREQSARERPEQILHCFVGGMIFPFCRRLTS
eukprot:scaffold1634_cov192-Pinguiococcus_pyrenoidosus.AAC.3